ncbi:MAG: hypothetical protein ACJAW4_000121, partial [Paracoccaceae bacterium]
GLDALRSAVLEAAEMAAAEEKHKARATG